MKFYLFTTTLLLFLTIQVSLAQQLRKDKGHFVESKNEYMDKIRESANTFIKKEKEPKMVFKMDLSGLSLPDTISQFTYQWHNTPVSQGYTGTCWCFSTTSYFESEIYRQTGQKLQLSTAYTVYWEYVEKARRFVQERGNSAFAEGAEANSVIRMWKKYGTMPYKAYTGLREGQEFLDHRGVYEEAIPGKYC